MVWLVILTTAFPPVRAIFIGVAEQARAVLHAVENGLELALVDRIAVDEDLRLLDKLVDLREVNGVIHAATIADAKCGLQSSPCVSVDDPPAEQQGDRHHGGL